MWPKLRRNTALLQRLVVLAEEHNHLLRELHLKLTGHHALTPRRNPSQTTSGRIRSASDVWTSSPLTQSQMDAQDRQRRSDLAGPSDSGFPESLDPFPIEPSRK